MKPPMLEPRTQTLEASTPCARARKRAILTTSVSAPGLMASAEAPWPRWSNASAAQPLAAQALPKSPWFSFRDPAPCRITMPAHGGGDSGSHKRYGRPSCTPASVGLGTVLLIALRNLSHVRPPASGPSEWRRDERYEQEGDRGGLGRLPVGKRRQRARPPRGGRLRRRRPRRRVRDSPLHLRGGGHPGAGACVRGCVPRSHRRFRGPLREQGGANHRHLWVVRGGGALRGRRVGRGAVHGASGGHRPHPDLPAWKQQDRG